MSLIANKNFDFQTASSHLNKIRLIFNPTIDDLANTLDVSRQEIYDWINGKSTPVPEKFEQIRILSYVADVFRNAGITDRFIILKMKIFKGQSLIDLITKNQLQPIHVQHLISEVLKINAAYDRSGLSKLKAKPSDDWCSEISIPGLPE